VVSATRESDEISILKENIPRQEILAQSIKSATSSLALIRCIDGHAESLKPNAGLHALRNLFQLYKYDP